MENTRAKLTMKGVAERKDSARRFLADGRYMTTGNPRRGGIAKVYRALDTLEERYIALKIFPAASGTDEIIEESFRRETQALSDLNHPNIVRILNAGLDAETGEHYIAMEWVEGDLATWCLNKPFEDWTEFFGACGRQILEALAFAHTHATVHRDIKPANILMTPEGVAKVCDFGISKIRNFLEPGVTLAQFASLPFAPPEPDDGTYSYSRDVFGFAALAVAALSETQIRDHADLKSVLDAIRVEESVRRVLRRSLSLDSASERPQNAAILLSELERLQPVPVSESKGTILLALTRKVSDIIKYDLGFESDSAVQEFIESDLIGAFCEQERSEPRSNPEGTPSNGRAVRIYGQRYGYVGKIAPPDEQKLVLVSALDLGASDIERSRERSFDARYRFAFTGTLPVDSRDRLAEFNDALLQFSADQKIVLKSQREQAIYRTWLDLLGAKAELERTRKRKFRYESFEQTGSAVQFKLPDGTDTSGLAEQDIRIELKDGEFRGSVVSVSDSAVVAQPSEWNRIEVDAIPEAGMLAIDTGRADAALEKQKSAVDAVRYGRSVNSQLGSYIVDPASVLAPAASDVEFIQSHIDDDKKEAVRAALAQPALMVVQGPPGTGKTTFITELVLQTLRERPESRVLLTSQTHVALDNSLERIARESNGTVQAVRIGHESDDRIPPSTKGLLVDRKLPVMRKEALARGRRFIEDWAIEHGVDLNYTRMAMALESRASLRGRLEYVDARIAELRPMLGEEKRKAATAEQLADIDEQLDSLMKEQDALVRDLKESLGELRQHEGDKDTIEHLAECSAAELRTWADAYATGTAEGHQLQKLLVAHADWEARFGRAREFRSALIASSQVVAGTCVGVMSIPGRNDIVYDLCIVDEASIATPTEVLVPMSRARRTVLVGDNKQLSPFQEPELKSSGLLARFDLRPEDQRATLFNHLNDGLPVELRKTLSTQHRMLPAIGNLISECFYDGQLQSVPREPAPYLQGVLPRPVVWYSTSRHANKSSKPVGTSHFNNLEVKHIVQLLGRADFTMRHGKGKGRKISVAVLTGYGEQKKRLHEAIDTKRHEWVSFSDIYINVVDAFQGREADMVIFSVTRSDGKGLGFLREMERINVALSRGKELLAIVGDHVFAQQAEERSNPLRAVLSYIQGNPKDCLLEEVAQ